MTEQKHPTIKQLFKEPVFLGFMSIYAVCAGMCTYSVATAMKNEAKLIQKANIKIQEKNTHINENY